MTDRSGVTPNQLGLVVSTGENMAEDHQNETIADLEYIQSYAKFVRGNIQRGEQVSFFMLDRIIELVGCVKRRLTIPQP